MNIYLSIITTVLVATQIIRVTQNTIQLYRQNVLYNKQLKEVADWEIAKQDIDRQKYFHALLIKYLEDKMNILNPYEDSYIEEIFNKEHDN